MPRYRSLLPFAGLCLIVGMWFSCDSPSSPVSRAQDVPQLSGDQIEQVTISENALHAFVSSDTLEIIAHDLTEYFAATNEGRWADLMHYFPMHKNKATQPSSKAALKRWITGPSAE